MAYTLNFTIGLGSAQTGLTLRAQLLDNVGADSGAEITTGFVELGDGYYLWHYEAFTDDFRGGVKFYENGVPGTVLAVSSINPEEAENLDEKVSDIIAELDGKVIISVNDLRRIIFG